MNLDARLARKATLRLGVAFVISLGLPEGLKTHFVPFVME